MGSLCRDLPLERGENFHGISILKLLTQLPDNSMKGKCRLDTCVNNKCWFNYIPILPSLPTFAHLRYCRDYTASLNQKRMELPLILLLILGEFKGPL